MHYFSMKYEMDEMSVRKERRKGIREENMKRCPEVNQRITKLLNSEK